MKSDSGAAEQGLAPDGRKASTVSGRGWRPTLGRLSSRTQTTGTDMAKTKTKPTKVSVKSFISAVENETRREDAQTLLKLFEKATGWPARMWGPTIVGFGAYHYTYETGHSGSSCVVGFSPRKASVVCYVSDFPGKADLLQKLGKHKGGLKQCLYINRLADVDTAVLEMILRAAVVATKKTWPVTAS
jgi:hypothetical protein